MIDTGYVIADDGGEGGGFNPITETTIDITGLTTIDMTGKTGYGIINLTSSNATETIYLITNCSINQEYVFRPESGLTITWQDQSVDSFVTSNLKLSAPNLVTVGDNNGYIALQRRVVVTPFGDTPLPYFFNREFLDVYTTFS